MQPGKWIGLSLFLLAVTRPASSPALAGIAHAAFRVSDLHRSLAFYRSLGFEPSFALADPGKPAVSYLKINDGQFLELYERADSSQSPRLLHICFEAADLQSLWNEYVARGLDPPKIKKGHAGNLLFALHDPENQVIEYTQYLPGSLHSEARGKHRGKDRISDLLLRVVIPARDPQAMGDFYTQRLSFKKMAAPVPCASVCPEILRKKWNLFPGRMGESHR